MHRARRVRCAALALLLLAGACSTAKDKGEPEPPKVRALGSLPSSCGQLGPVPPGGEVSFITGGRVYVVSPTGSGAACVGEVAAPDPIQWSPTGDAYLVAGFDSVEVHTQSGVETLTGPGDHARLQGFSRPTGANLLFISSDGTALAKAPTNGGASKDISLLRRHDEAVYHPSGAQLAVIGQTTRGDYGIFLATNEGTEQKEIVPVTSEDEFYGLAYAHDGSALYFVADEHDSWELHAADLTNPARARPREKMLFDAPAPIAAPLVSLLSGNVIAYRQGDCDSRLATYVRDERGTRRVGAGLGDTQPVGWLPDGTLVVAASDDLCDPARKLDLYVVQEDRQSLLVEDVDQAAVRVALPPAPGPAGEPVGDPAGE
jgi:hypothetical protein